MNLYIVQANTYVLYTSTVSHNVFMPKIQKPQIRRLVTVVVVVAVGCKLMRLCSIFRYDVDTPPPSPRKPTSIHNTDAGSICFYPSCWGYNPTPYQKKHARRLFIEHKQRTTPYAKRQHKEHVLIQQWGHGITTCAHSMPSWQSSNSNAGLQSKSMKPFVRTCCAYIFSAFDRGLCQIFG